MSIAASLLLSVSVAFAEEGSTNAVPNVETTVGSPAPATVKAETEKAARERVKAEVAAKKAEIEKAVREAKERVKAAKESAADARKAIATTTRADIKEIRQTAKERIESVREEAKERVKQEREKAKERMKSVQDKKRQEMMQKLAERFENLNKTWTDEFAKKLDRFTVMLNKMQSRATTAAVNGKDVTAANAAIQAAKDVVITTQASVAAQAAKVYIPDASTLPTTAATSSTPQGQEELTKALKLSFQTLHSTLFKDLFALRDGPMTVARKAIQDALTALGKVPGVDEKSTSATSNQ